MCRIICGCLRKSAARSGSEKNSGKKLNFMDKDYYETAEKLLSEEFTLALQTTPDAACGAFYIRADCTQCPAML